jgi:hypothetical protein
MARPKQREELKRSHKVTLMYTENEYDEISGKAKEAGITLSTYIRSKSLYGHVHVPKYAKIDSASVRELSRLGGLLKHHFNVTRGEHKDKTGEILRDISAIILEVKKSLDDRQAHRQP